MAETLVDGSLRHGVTEPGLEPRPEDEWVAVGHQRLVVELRTKVASMDIGGDLACVVLSPEDPADDFIEVKPLRPGNLDRAVYWRCQHDICQCGHDIIREDRLDEGR